MSRFAWLALCVGLMAAGPASATSFSFHCISGDGGGECAIPTAELWVEVQDEGAGEFSITLHNETGVRAPLTALYIEDGDGLIGGLVSIGGSVGVDFRIGAKPPGLPSGSVEDFREDWSFSARNPKPKHGVGSGESLTVVFSLADGFSYADVLAAMNDGSLRVGLHAPPIGSGGNKSLVTHAGGAIPAPEPSTLALLLAGGVGWAVRRRRS